MKKTILLGLSILLGGLAYSQGEIHLNGVNVSGTTLDATTADVNELLYVHDLMFVNTSGAEMKIKVRRLRVCTSDNLGSEQLCYGGDTGLCFSATGYNYTTPGSGAVTPMGDSLAVDAKQQGDGAAAGYEAWLYMVNGDTGEDLDSVKVNYSWDNGSCTQSIEESAISHSVSVYPNPASNVLNFAVELGQNNSASIQVVDMLGKKVLAKRINNNTEKVSFNVSDLNEGVYFYSLNVDGKIIETKKIVVKH